MANIIGTPGNDRGINALNGTNGPDTINRDGDPRSPNGTRGADELFGFRGNDILYGGPGSDRLDGGSHRDTASYVGATAGVKVNLNLTGPQNTRGAGTDTLVSIENLTGSRFNDVLLGNGANNVLSGMAGNDTLHGGGGDDTLNGGTGNDTLLGYTGDDRLNGGDGNDRLLGGSGDDVLNGGAGSDTASYATATAGVTVFIDTSPSGNDGEPQNTIGAGIDQLVSIENLTGSTFNDTLGGFEFFGGTLDGGAGNDQLFVVDSGARLNGGAGNDQLEISQVQGFGSHSTLYGGAGADHLTDSSFDHFEFTTSFYYAEVSDSNLVDGMDTIVGFQGKDILGEMSDQIDLGDIDANGNPNDGNQAFTWRGGGGITAAGQLRYDNGTQRLQGNTDSNLSTVEFEIQLNDVALSDLFVQAGHAGSDILL